MKRRTTTAQINEALANDLLIITKVECYRKTLRQTNVINPESFIEDFQFLCEANIFMDCVGWTYQQDYRTGDYVLESGRSDGDSENIITIHMRVNEGVKTEDIEKMLLMKEED
jgi:hypothetical protein